MDTVRKGLLSAGFDSDSSEIYLRSHTTSTTGQYQSVWSKFLEFLDSTNTPHSTVNVATVCNFLSHQAKVVGLQYRTVSGYRCALRLPILWASGLDINCFTSDQFLRGLFNFTPPVRCRPMPIWNVNVLLEFLLSDEFEPLDSVPFIRLAQKTLCLLLLASGRRIGEIASISRSHDSDRGFLYLDRLPSFRPKHHDAGFQSPQPSISYLAGDGSEDLGLCPVRAYRIYLDRSSTWLGSPPSQLLETPYWVSPNSSQLSIHQLSSLFIKLVQGSLHASGQVSNVKIGPHQMRKLAASLALDVGQNEDKVRVHMGFSSLNILRKNYVARVPPLKFSCVLPGGPFIYTASDQLSDSD